MLDTPKHSDLIFDIGLHKGEDTDFYLRKGFRVIAFEADPDLAQRCRERFTDALANGSLTIVHGAIVDPERTTPGTRSIKFFKNPDHSVWGTVNANWSARNESLGARSVEIEVPVVDFVGALQRYGIPHYMKIDIEGCDMVCVRALRSFRQKPDYLSIESDKLSIKNIRSEIKALAELGYDAFKAVEQSSVPLQQQPHPCREGKAVSHKFPDGSSGLFGADLPGEWRSADSIIRRYRPILLKYALFGDRGLLAGLRNPWAVRLRDKLAFQIMIRTGEPVPGWYDTHARLAAHT